MTTESLQSMSRDALYVLRAEASKAAETAGAMEQLQLKLKILEIDQEVLRRAVRDLQSRPGQLTTFRNSI